MLRPAPALHGVALTETAVEVVAGEEAEVSRLTEEALTGAADLRVPLTISMATGPSWAAAKG